MVIQPDHWISLEEYHELERNSEVKYEYCNGRIYEMSGVTAAHCRIAMNMLFKLHVHLQGKTCSVAGSDMKVLPLDSENPSYYPDVSVTCSPDDYQDDSTAIRSPHLIIEVLSPSTFVRDRGEKLKAYKACASCEEYVMASSHHQEVEVYRRKSASTWENTQYTADEVVTLASVGLTIPMAEIYAKTKIPSLGLPALVFCPF
jgi:Uma2 family endonuclease